MDPSGNMIYLTNRNGKVWHRKMDKANRLTNTISPLLRKRGQIYNNRGLGLSVTEPSTQSDVLIMTQRGG